MQTQGKKYITFGIDQSKYAIPIEEIQEILRMMPITLVPSESAGFKGISRLRGEVVPVYELGILFGYAPGVEGKSTRIIIFSKEGRLAGLIVDAVYKVIELDTIHPVHDQATGVAGKLFGIGKYGEELFGLLHAEDALRT